MFRAQNNQLDNAVAKATDENLTSEPWDLILEVCDQVSASAAGPQQAVAALIKRLAHRNANVQLYTLELANALSQNCGAELHRELASKAFTDALLRLAGDRTTHAQVKQKVLERMAAWTEGFKSSPELGIMEQAYGRLRTTQPGLVPPSKPVKKEISSEDRRKEEEELQMALALSIKDKEQEGKGKGKEEGGGAQGSESAGQQQQQQQQGTTAATVSRVRALYDFTPSEAGELAFRKGDVIAVLESVYKDWWKGSLRGNTGIFPLNYVEKLQDPTKEELERDAQMEAEVFGEIKNVEKLLALLSVRTESGGGRRGEREEDEISELYNRTLAIRPKLIELIGKYSQKKDDFTQLNEKFIKARRDYEALLESSMSQSQYQQQQQFPIRQRPPPHQMYPIQQQPPYQQAPPSQPYPHQAPPPAQGYPPQQPYAQQSQQHLPPQGDVQRFYSPAPSEPPAQPQQQGGYVGGPYPNGSPAVQPSNGPAPFHFIPGGLQAPPPSQQAQQEIIRRKPSPQAPLSAGPGPGPTDPYNAQQQAMFQGQVRPNSIHTLNSGNPQELATGGYESPVDNRHSYPSAHPMGGLAPVQEQAPMGMQSPPAGYDGGYAPQPQQQQHAQFPPQQHAHPQQPQQQQQFPPQQQQPQPQQTPQQQRILSDRDTLPSRQRTHSFESPTSVYSASTYTTHQPDSTTNSAGYSGGNAPPPWEGGNPGLPPQPSAPPPEVPGPGGVQQYQAYQAYQPQQSQEQRGGGDPGDFYR